MHALRLALKLTLWTAALLVFTVGILVVFLAVVGDDFYRRAGQHVLDQSMDREVRVKGAFTFDVDLEPTLVMTDFTIANAPWASTRNFAQVERVHGEFLFTAQV